MSNGVDPDTIRKAMVSPRWAALTRLDTSVEELAQWDPRLLRQSRVDVQALYVPPGDPTLFVRLQFGLTAPVGQPPAEMPVPFAPGEHRPAGVHLHWAPPDSLLRGEVREVEGGATNRLALPPLPDRW